MTTVEQRSGRIEKAVLLEYTSGIPNEKYPKAERGKRVEPWDGSERSVVPSGRLRVPWNARIAALMGPSTGQREPSDNQSS